MLAQVASIVLMMARRDFLGGFEGLEMRPDMCSLFNADSLVGVGGSSML